MSISTHYLPVRYTISMLVLSKSLLNQPVMSLRTGRPVATAVQAIINPNNLKIEGFYCIDSENKGKQLVLLHRDIRDVLPAGIVVDDYDVLTEPEDLVRLKKVMEYQFEVIGKAVVTDKKARLGKVTDYSTDPESMYIKKLYVVQSVFKSLSGGNLGIDRNQIVEVTNSKIVVRDLLQPVPADAPVTEPMPAG